MMKKVWLIAAIALILVGSLAFVGAMALSGFDFSVLDTQELVSNTYVFEDTIEKILVDVDTTDIRFLPAEDGVCKVVCQERDKLRHAVYVNEKTLFIKLVDTRDWYEHIEFFGSEMKITVYLPTDTLETICVKVSTGKLELADITCKNFTTTGSTGKVSLKNLIATEKMELRRSTGDVALDGCDGAEIIVKTGTGDITGTLLSQKTFTAQTDTGRISVPQSTTGGPCTLTTSTGNIEIECKMQNA